MFVTAEQMLHGSPLRGWSGSFFHSQHMTFGIWDIADGAAPLHVHHHEQEEVWHVVAGAIAITVDGDERVVAAGSAVIVPPHTPHSVRPLGACRAIVADWPMRTSLPGVATPVTR